MGYMRHHAIVVTSWSDEAIEKAHKFATDTYKYPVSPVSEPAVNGERSFCIFPDGSKEWWDDSDNGEAQRKAIIDYFRTTNYEDGSGPLEWVLVQFGDDEYETKVVDDSDAHMRDTEEAT